MRVISGSARGCKLFALEGLETRPTTDRIKETLFNIISQEIYDCCFLDIFSGSGAIGIEALSRGAKRAVFVEKSDAAVSVINKNIEKTRVGDRAEVLKTDALSAVKILAKRGEKFDLVYMDPPYNNNMAWPVMEALKENGLLNEDAIVIVEESSEAQLPQIKGFEMYRTKQFKTTVISFWNEENIDA